MTLLVRDEVDVVRQHLLFHLNAGVDFVIVTDNGSVDGTSEVLAELRARRRRPRAPRAGGRVPPARVADAHGAPRRDRARRRLGDQQRRGRVLVAARRRRCARCSPQSRRGTGSCGSLVRHFVPLPDDGRPFEERMTLRLAAQAPVNDPREPVAARIARSSIAPIPAPLRDRGGPRPARDASSRRSAAGTRSSASTSRCARPRRSSAKGAAWGAAVEKFYEGSGRGPRARCRLPRAPASRRASGARSRRYYDALALTPDDVAHRPRARPARRGHARPRRASRARARRWSARAGGLAARVPDARRRSRPSRSRSTRPCSARPT